MKYTKWSVEEVNLLKELYPNVRVKYLINKFPNRNAGTIVARALSLGLSSAKLWKQQENEILKRCFANTAKDELLSLLPKRTWTAIVAQGERLELKRKIDKPKLAINEDYFKSWSSNMAYILGLILADGCITEGTYKGYSDSLKFGFKLSDIEIIEKIKKELKAEHKISINKNSARFSIVSQKLVSDLKKLGISYRKSLNEKIPKVPNKYVKDFIRGVIDGDGSIMIDKKGYPVVMACGGEKTMDFIRTHFFHNLDVYSKIGRRKYSQKCANFLCEIRYKSNSALKVLSYLYNNEGCLYLDRKYKLAKRCLEIKIKERKNHHKWEFI